MAKSVRKSTSRRTQGKAKLRRELHAAQKILVPATYLEKLDELKRTFGHRIVPLEEGRNQLRRFNCYAYALGVWDHPAYQAMVDAHAEDTLTVLNSGVVSGLIAGGYLKEIAGKDAKPGDIVGYFYDGQLVHFARVEVEGFVCSKWGANEVHKHQLWEVPASYGDRVRYFQKPDIETVLAHLTEER
jgi:hypothetical protein